MYLRIVALNLLLFIMFAENSSY